MKVLLVGARLCRNFGGPSLLVTTTRILDEYLEDAEYTLLSPTSEDLRLAERYGVAILPGVSKRKLLLAALMRSVSGLSFGDRRIREVVDAFSQADVVVDIWGIKFAESLGSNTLVAGASGGVHWFVAKLFRKPVVKYTADLGPFLTVWNRFFARFYLQRTVDLILARSGTTQQRIDDLGVTTPVMVCPDSAFLLECRMNPLAEKLSRQALDRPIVGFSVSHVAARLSGKREKYLESMAALADHVVGPINAKVILIPNEFSDDIAHDDVHIAEEVRNRMSRKSQATIISSGEYTAQELKGILGQCDVVVAARYHTIVASLSQAIPVLAVGWHAKYAGVLALVGQERYLCSIESLELDDLQQKFDDLWRSREGVREEIGAALPGIREAILRGAEAVSFLLKQKVAEAL